MNTPAIKRVCQLCGKPITVYIVKKPKFRITVGCRECSIFEDEQGQMRHYVGDITYLPNSHLLTPCQTNYQV